MLDIQKQIVQREVELRERFDFTKITLEQMKDMDAPGDLVGRAAWNKIRVGRTRIQQEIEDLKAIDNILRGWDFLSDADKRVRFKQVIAFEEEEAISIIGVEHHG